MQVVMPTIEHSDERVVEVVHQMPTVRYLYGLWGAERRALGITTGSVTADDLDAGPLSQPSGQSLGGTIR
jgi:hypothetical protein